MNLVKKYLKEEKYSLKDVPEDFWNDPLYKKVLTSKNPKEFKKALETLLSIRGSSAVAALQQVMKQKK